MFFIFVFTYIINFIFISVITNIFCLFHFHCLFIFSDSLPGDVFVGRGRAHPALYYDILTVRASRMSWTAGVPPKGIRDQLKYLIRERENQRQEQRREERLNGVDKKEKLKLRRDVEETVINNDSVSSSVSVSASVGSDGGSNSGSDSGIVDTSDDIKSYRCHYKARYLQPVAMCSVRVRLLESDSTREKDSGSNSNSVLAMGQNHINVSSPSPAVSVSAQGQGQVEVVDVGQKKRDAEKMKELEVESKIEGDQDKDVELEDEEYEL